jgi:uncharacterized membrane protein
MRTLLTILCFTFLQASGQALFHAHNRVTTPAVPEEVLPVTSGLVGWWKASAVVTSGADVTEWTDKSGSGYHLAPITGPAGSLVADAYNGQPTVRFTDPYQQYGSTGFANLSAITVFVAYKNSSTANGAIVGKWAGYEGWMLYAGTPNGFFTSNWHQVTTSTAFNVTTLQADASQKSAWVNGVPTLSTTGAIVSTTAELEIGRYGNTPATGLTDVDISEIIIFNRVLSSAERAAVEDHLKAKYGL